MRKYLGVALFWWLLCFRVLCQRPEVVLVGIISQPASKSLNSSFYLPTKTQLYVPTSYTRYIEQTGAMSVIIPYDLPNEEFTALINSLDAFLLPGGGSVVVNSAGNKTFYQTRIEQILDMAVRRNDNGDTVVIQGTCQGFQQIGLWGTSQPGGKRVPLNDFLICDLDDETWHPVLKGKDLEKSSIFSVMNQDLVNAGFNNGNLYYSHHCRFKVEEFVNNVGEVFHLTGSSKDDQGREFVASFEHKKYPIYGTQYHPEKTQFERLDSMQKLPRDPQTIRFVRDYMSFIVEKVRHKAKPLSEYPGFLMGYFSFYHQYMIHPGHYFENSYTTQSFNIHSDQGLEQDDKQVWKI